MLIINRMSPHLGKLKFWIPLSGVFLLVFFVRFEATGQGLRPSPSADSSRYLNLFQGVLEQIRTFYIDGDKATLDRLVYGAIKGMLDSLGDPHTVFLNRQRYESLRNEIQGSFEGVGINVAIKEGKLIVMSPMEETPAWEVGIKPGDVIDRIEGLPTTGITIDEAVTRLRGPLGSPVNLSIVREGEEKPIDFKLTRTKIEIKTIVSEKIESTSTGYIRVRSFAATTRKHFEDAIRSLKAESVNSLIIDLRNNPGGDLHVAVEMVDLFLEQGRILSTRDRNGKVMMDLAATRDVLVPRYLPVILLVNGYSASASEIFAGALQDHKRAVLLGEKTYGKFSVQELRDIDPEERTGFKMTVARYYLPSGRSLHSEGIQPDIAASPELFTAYETKMISRIQARGLVNEYLRHHPDESRDRENLPAFIQSLNAEGIDLPLASLELLVSQMRHQKDLPKKYDLRFDKQLREALKILRGSEILNQKNGPPNGPG